MLERDMRRTKLEYASSVIRDEYKDNPGFKSAYIESVKSALKETVAVWDESEYDTIAEFVSNRIMGA